MTEHSSVDAELIRTLIVTDVNLFLEGLVRVLAPHLDVTVVGSATHNHNLLEIVRSQHPHVVLIDATTVRVSELVRLLGESVPGLPVVALAIDQDDDDEVLACAEAGVSGYVARDASADELVAVLHSAVHGEVRCPPHVTATVFKQMARLAPYRSVASGQRNFTPREVEIAALIERGLSNKEIARRLHIEVATVKNHVHNILDKLQVRRRGEIAAFLNPPQRQRHKEPRKAPI